MTLNGKTIHSDGHSIFIRKGNFLLWIKTWNGLCSESPIFDWTENGFSEDRDIGILFEELFYGRQNPYRIMCVEGFLEGGSQVGPLPTMIPLPVPVVHPP